MQSTYFNRIVVVYGHETLWFWSFELNIFQGLTLNFDPDNLPVRQMVIFIVPAEGRLLKVSIFLGSCDGWVVQLGLDRNHMKPKECFSSPHWGTGPPPSTWHCCPTGSWGEGEHAFGVTSSEPSVRLAITLCEVSIIMLTRKPWPERLGCEGK